MEYICPLCKTEGDIVQRITIESLVNDHFKKHLKSSEYGLCKNPDCDIVYFNNETSEVYFQRDIKVPVWYKNQENPIVCYCGNVTLKDIIELVVEKQEVKTFQELVNATGAMKNCRCKTQNPSGKCCKEVLEDAFNYAISLISDKPNQNLL
ncbi:(2Fe-2S)-binding protein [Caloramator proteoclasticus]|uniref:BFD-like [2Fe-2S] binding domain-containing protein n=1 Tax=Caloramator proteoclasticus DSM 10124 TaxID=1121262 RepID=A0A1M4V598_9CLOT|nr:(2Fe-2S)-binding protein [Caloramator proteoclasticus]SHE64109.1 BFD-like [2Fe-2S] binding domain-containing protein [Caloramator proteoclasticus DSM 10124]